MLWSVLIAVTGAALAAPGVLGAPEDGPWDRILVSADAGTLPRALVDQLVPEGVMVLPVKGWMHRVTRDPGFDGDGEATGDARVEVHGSYRFVPLVED